MNKFSQTQISKVKSLIRNYSSMSASSEWLKAYEAQNSKALEQLSAGDAGWINSNVSGFKNSAASSQFNGNR